MHAKTNYDSSFSAGDERLDNDAIHPILIYYPRSIGVKSVNNVGVKFSRRADFFL